MSLPVVPLPRDFVVVGDVKVEVRGMSRGEALCLPGYKDDPSAAEVFILSVGAGVDQPAAKAWLDASPSDAVDAVLEKILELSGLTEGAEKSGVPGVPDEGE